MKMRGGQRGFDLLRRGVIDMAVPQFQDRRRVAAPHAGRAQNPHLSRIQIGGQGLMQCLRAGQFARQGVADPDRDRGWRRLPLFHHVEMGIEGRDLVNFGLRQTHLIGQGTDMRRSKVPVVVLN